MRKQRKDLTPHFVRLVVRDYAEGAPIALIGRQYGIHETTVCLIAKRAGLPRRERSTYIHRNNGRFGVREGAYQSHSGSHQKSWDINDIGQ